MKKNKYNYCPYCNGEKKVKRDDGKIITCFACNGTGKRRKDYGAFYQK